MKSKQSHSSKKSQYVSTIFMICTNVKSRLSGPSALFHMFFHTNGELAFFRLWSGWVVDKTETTIVWYMLINPMNCSRFLTFLGAGQSATIFTSDESICIRLSEVIRPRYSTLVLRNFHSSTFSHKLWFFKMSRICTNPYLWSTLSLYMPCCH